MSWTLIQAARDDGATWSLIAAALGGSRNRKTVQKGHADLSRCCPRPPSVDTPAPELSSPGRGLDKAIVEAPAPEADPPPPRPARQDPQVKRRRGREDFGLRPALAPAPSAGRRAAPPKIIAAVIAEGRYELMKAPDHAQTRAWHVLVSGARGGLVRPT